MEGITLGNPSALWGLLLLALPLYAHFSKLIRPQKTVFSDLRLLRHVWESQSRKSQPNQRILLLIRLLSILLGVALFAQIRTGEPDPSAPWVWYLDASASMEMPFDANQTRFEAAVQEAKAALEQCPSDQWIEIKSEALPLGSSTRSAEEWLRSLDSLRPTAGTGQGQGLIVSAQWAITDGYWSPNKGASQGKFVTLVAGDAAQIPWPDSAWVLPNPKGENRWTGYVRFPAHASPSQSQKLSWWAGGKQIQWTVYQGVSGKGQTVQSEFTLDPGSRGLPLELRFSHGGKRFFWLPPKNQKTILYVGPSSFSEWEPSPAPFRAETRKRWSASDLDPNKTALLVVSEWDRLPLSEKAALRSAAQKGIAVLGTHRGLPGSKDEVFDVINASNEFYSSIIVRMPAALEGVRIPSSGLPDSLHDAAYVSLLGNTNNQVALSMHRRIPLFWWAAGWDRTTGGNLPSTPLLYAWIKRMAEWPNRQARLATTASSVATISITEGNLVQNSRILTSGQGGNALSMLQPGWVTHQRVKGDTIAVYAIHPPRAEYKIEGLRAPSLWDDWEKGPPTSLRASNVQDQTSLWLALLALALVASETYFARKSLPLTP